MGTGLAIQHVSDQIDNLNCWSYPNFITTDHDGLASLIGNELQKDLRKWIAPPDPSVNYNAASSAHREGTTTWCTNGNTFDWKTSGSLFWIYGKRTYTITVRV